MNIEDFLIKENIEYRKEGKNVGRDEINICCPGCSEEKYHLGINSKKEICHCWICGWGGDLVKLVSKLKNISYREAKTILKGSNRLKEVLENRKVKKMEKHKKSNSFIKKFSFPAYSLPFKVGKNIWEKTAIKFMKEKYDLEWGDILKTHLHYCYWGKYKNNVIVPVYRDKRLVNFVARCWDKKGHKRYNNCPNNEALLPINQTLYNLDNIKKNQHLLVIVEGPFDCIKVGLNIAVATFGTEVSKTQLKLLAELKVKNIIVLFDNDAYKKSKKLANYLSPFCSNIKAVELPVGRDPGDLNRKELSDIINI